MLQTAITTSQAADERAIPLGIRVLWAASALGGLGQSLSGTAGALLARQVGGSDAVAGLPQTFLVVGSAIAAIALSRLTVRHGRGVALSTGAGIAVCGCAAVTAAAVLANLPLILLGTVLLGTGNTAVMLGRYAAADLAPGQSRATAMGSVLVAITVGAVAGPNLLAPAGDLAGGMGLPGLAGPYVVSALAFIAAAGTLAIGLRARPRTSTPAIEPGVVTRVRLGRPGWVGLAVLSVANLVMVSVMMMAPVEMHHHGSGFAAIGLVVSMHIAGMFAPSPVSGWLTDRYGAAATAAGAGLTLILASWLAAVAGSSSVLAVALVLLGIGWNLGLLSGSALLTADTDPAERPRREGLGEVGMGIAAAGGGVAAGPLMAGGSYQLLAASGAVAAGFVLPLAWRGRRS